MSDQTSRPKRAHADKSNSSRFGSSNSGPRSRSGPDRDARNSRRPDSRGPDSRGPRPRFDGERQDRPQTSSARFVAHALVLHVLREWATLDEALAASTSFPKLSDRDRRLARQLATTCLRHLGQLQRTLIPYLETPLPVKNFNVKVLLLLGLTEHHFLRTPSHAMVSEMVSIARSDRSMSPFQGLVNAILRRVSEGEKGALPSPRFNIPKWLAARWHSAYGEEWLVELADRLGEIPSLDLTLKPGCTAPDVEHEVLPHGALRLATGMGAVTSLPGYDNGSWWVQDAAAQIPVLMAEDLSRKRVLDLCAAPGGKTMQLAAAGAQVTAVDISESRLERLRQNLDRCGLEAEIVAQDALTFTTEDLFDVVLLDAPCSATGTLRRHPELLAQRKEFNLLHNRRLQAKLIGRAAKLLKPGGILIYAVCSLEPEEGIQQVQAAIKALPLQQAPMNSTPNWLSEMLTPEGYLRTYPQTWSQWGGMDGFFAARLQKRFSNHP